MKIPKEPQKRDRTPESDEDPRASSKWPRTKKGGLENLDKLPEDVWVRHVLPEAMLELRS
jgi:hypothetical protein